MTRLTVELREIIIRAALKDAFKKEAEAIEEKKRTLGQRVYRHLVSEKLEKQAMLAPEEFRSACLVSKVTMYLYRRGAQHHEYAARIEGIPGLEGKPMSRTDADRCKYGSLNVYDADKLIPAANEIQLAEKKLKADREGLQKSVKALVYGATTVKALLEIWPEGKSFIPAQALEAPKKAAALPAMLVSEVNKSLVKAGVELAAA